MMLLRRRGRVEDSIRSNENLGQLPSRNACLSDKAFVEVAARVRVVELLISGIMVRIRDSNVLDRWVCRL